MQWRFGEAGLYHHIMCLNPKTFTTYLATVRFNKAYIFIENPYEGSYEGSNAGPNEMPNDYPNENRDIIAPMVKCVKVLAYICFWVKS